MISEQEFELMKVGYDANIVLADFLDEYEPELPEFDPNDETQVKDVIRAFVISEFERISDALKQRALNGLEYITAQSADSALKYWNGSLACFDPPDDARLLYRWTLDILEEHIKTKS